jgi:septum formation protein
MASKISRVLPLCLGSASPRRRQLLEQVGIPLVVRAVSADEDVRAGEAVDAYLARVVGDKLARAVAASGEGVAAVLVADTVVVSNGEILGKPLDDGDARRMLSRLAGREHWVATRYAVAVGGAAVAAETVRTTVWFRALDAAQIDAYVATGEGRDKAGSYAVQGVGAMLVRRIDGDYANVVGLPICAVVEALQRLELLGACPPPE